MANFKLQTDKLKSYEMKVYITFLKATETDWQSIHIHILRNLFYLPWYGLSARIDSNRPFYSCVLSDLALDWKQGWGWPCFDTNLTAFHM